MGAGWRRISERARQNFGIGTDATFQPTPNLRNQSMLQEAEQFSNHLKRVEKEIRTVKTATEGLLSTTKIVMSAPLPRVFEDVGGKVQPVGSGPGSSNANIGGEFKADDLTRTTKEVTKKLEAEVLAPMQRWMTAYNTVQGRMKRLEGVRLEVDSRRRTVMELGLKIDNQRARLPQTRHKGEFNLEQTVKKMQHKENKLAAARQSYKEQEALVYQQLAQLIRDAVWLKSYLAAVMRLETEAFQNAYAALGPAKGSLPVPLPEDMTGVQGVTDHVHSGMIAASRPYPGPPTTASAGIARSLSTKTSLKRPSTTPAQPSGKENGVALSTAGKEYGQEFPAVPTHHIQRRTESRGYDRYGEQIPAY